MTRTVAALAILLVAIAGPARSQCCGDCDGDGVVVIANLVTAVRNALNGCGIGPCCGDCNGDGRVAVSELISAVGRALGACDPTFTPTPTATATITSTPTVTNTATASYTATPTDTPLRSVDNGDGTITDLSTGLRWEKKTGGDSVPDGSNLHDADNRYPWRGKCQNTDVDCTDGRECAADVRCLAGDQQGTRLTIFTWLAGLNDARFADQDDWRIPTLAELRSLRDLDERPTIDPGFHAAGCSTACLDLGDADCSCTGAGPYWTASEDPADPGRAWRIDFDNGAIVSSNKGDDLRIRAVRGP